MTATEIDYEAEYNNRARVPGHPQIFERWRAEAKAFRDEMTAQSRAELAVAYGTPPRQIIDLFLAEPDSGKLAMFVHGGYWRSLEPATFSHLARGLLAHGISVAVVGYDLCPQVRVADIIGEIRQACLYLWRRFGKRMFVYGHSAGGHLAACALATDWKELGMPRDAVPAACAISGVFDLTPLIGISMNQDLRLDLLEARRVSPLFWNARRDRRRAGIARVPAPEPGDRRGLGRGRSYDALRGSAGQSFHRARPACGSGERHGQAARGARGANAALIGRTSASNCYSRQLFEETQPHARFPSPLVGEGGSLRVQRATSRVRGFGSSESL